MLCTGARREGPALKERIRTANRTTTESQLARSYILNTLRYTYVELAFLHTGVYLPHESFFDLAHPNACIAVVRGIVYAC